MDQVIRECCIDRLSWHGFAASSTIEVADDPVFREQLVRRDGGNVVVSIGQDEREVVADAEVLGDGLLAGRR